MTATTKPPQEKEANQKPEITTIKLTKKTKTRLNGLKTHKRETYEETIRKMLGILNICKVNPLHAKSKLLQIDKQRKSST